MKIIELKNLLDRLENLEIYKSANDSIPSHYHLTEIGVEKKDFIDCGGTQRQSEHVVLQLWVANDTDHRLKPTKLRNIINLAERKLNLPNAEIIVEFQANTINRFGLNFANGKLFLENLYTDCLATDACGIPQDFNKQEALTEACCAGSNCC